MAEAGRLYQNSVGHPTESISTQQIQNSMPAHLPTPMQRVTQNSVPMPSMPCLPDLAQYFE